MPRDTHPSSSISPGTPHRCLGSSARPLSVHVEKNHPHTDTFTSSSTFTPRAQKSVCTGQSKSASYFACPPPRAHSTRPPAPPGLGLAVDRLPGVPTACAAPGRLASRGSNGVKTGVRCARARSLSEQRVNKQRSTPVGSVLLSHGNDRKSTRGPILLNLSEISILLQGLRSCRPIVPHPTIICQQVSSLVPSTSVLSSSRAT